MPPMSNAERSRRKRENARLQRIAQLEQEAAQSNAQFCIVSPPQTQEQTPLSSLSTSSSQSILPPQSTSPSQASLPSFDSCSLPYHRYPTRRKGPVPTSPDDHGNLTSLLSTQLSSLRLNPRAASCLVTPEQVIPTPPTTSASVVVPGDTDDDADEDNVDQSNIDAPPSENAISLGSVYASSDSDDDGGEASRHGSDSNKDHASNAPVRSSSQSTARHGVPLSRPTPPVRPRPSIVHSDGSATPQGGSVSTPREGSPVVNSQYEWLRWQFPTPDESELDKTRRQIQNLHAPTCSCDKNTYGEGYTLRDMTEYIQREAGPSFVQSTFENDVSNLSASRDRLRTSAPLFQHMLSDADKPELSFASTENAQSAAQEQLSVLRQWDIDSYVIQLRSLAAFPTQSFSVSYIPPFSTSIAQTLHCSFDSVQPHKTHNIQLGSFTNSRHNLVHLIFPKSPPIKKHHTPHLTFAMQEKLVDDCILPALYQSCYDSSFAQHPTSFRHARARASTSRPDAYAPKRRQHAHLQYPIPACFTGLFWDHLQERCNKHPSGYFADPILLLQEHSIKDITIGNTPEEALHNFYRGYLSEADPAYLIPDATWVDFAFRDIPCIVGPRNQAHDTIPSFTLAYKRACLSNLVRDPEGAFQGFSLREWTQYLFRDLGSAELIRNHVGPRTAKPAMCQVKMYNSHKQHMWTPDKGATPFDMAQFDLMALGPDLLETYYRGEANMSAKARAPLKIPALLEDFQSQKTRLFHYLSPPTSPVPVSYSTRREWKVLWSHLAALDLREPAAFYQTLRPFLPSDPGTHNPFFLVPTRDLNDLLLASAARMIVPIEKLAVFAMPNPMSPAEQFPVDQRHHHLLMNRTLLMALRMTCTSSIPSKLPWLWKPTYTHRRRDGSKRQYRGLGLEGIVQRHGIAWFPDDLIEWHVPRLTNFAYRQLRPTLPWLPHNYNIVRRGITGSELESEAMFHTTLHGHFQQVLELARTPSQYKAAQTIRNEAFKLALQSVVYSYNIEFIRAHEPFLKRLDLPYADFRKVLYGDREPADMSGHLQIVSALTLYEMYIRAFAALGEDRVTEELRTGQMPSDNGMLPFPIMACQRAPRKGAKKTEYDKDGSRSWSVYVQSMLSGMDNKSSWAGKIFVEKYKYVQDAWTSLFLPSGDIITRDISPDDWTNFCRAFAGTYIFVTPSFERTKFLYVQTSRRVVDQRYSFFNLSYCCPGLSTKKIRELDGLRASSITQLLREALLSTVSTYAPPAPHWLATLTSQACAQVYPHGRKNTNWTAASGHPHPGYEAIIQHLANYESGLLYMHFEQPFPLREPGLHVFAPRLHARLSVYSHQADIPLLPVDVLAQPDVPGTTPNRLVPAAERPPGASDEVIKARLFAERYFGLGKGLELQLSTWAGLLEISSNDSNCSSDDVSSKDGELYEGDEGNEGDESDGQAYKVINAGLNNDNDWEDYK